MAHVAGHLSCDRLARVVEVMALGLGGDGAADGCLQKSIVAKPKGHDFDYARQSVAGQVTRHMSHTGG